MSYWQRTSVIEMVTRILWTTYLQPCPGCLPTSGLKTLQAQVSSVWWWVCRDEYLCFVSPIFMDLLLGLWRRAAPYIRTNFNALQILEDVTTYRPTLLKYLVRLGGGSMIVAEYASSSTRQANTSEYAKYMGRRTVVIATRLLHAIEQSHTVN